MIDRARLVALIQSLRLPLHDEKRTQAELANALTAADIQFVREVRLSGKDIVDFMVGGIAIELKTKGQRMAIFRQLERYAEHEKVESIILATNVSMHLPTFIGGKPAQVASLGKGYL